MKEINFNAMKAIPLKMNRHKKQNFNKLGLRPRCKVEHWTPKGDCKVAGIKERKQL